MESPCLAVSPDTVRYDVPRGEKEADVFDGTLRLRKPTDAALGAVHVRPHIASRKRSQLLTPNAHAQVLPMLYAGSSVDVVWKMNPPLGVCGEEERILASIDGGDCYVHAACDAMTLIEGGLRDESLRYLSAYHVAV